MRGVTSRTGKTQSRIVEISTRTPHAGSDTATMATKTIKTLFQPALPMRGVTNFCKGYMGVRLFQPALPMRGVTTSL